MKLLFTRRAEIAFRSLDPREQQKVSRALEVIDETDLGKIKMPKLASSEKLYKLRVGNLRVILSKAKSDWVLQDIVYKDRLSPIRPASEPQ
jgi:mRNA-degrading endonuclease RelE of RelBE toxin-antitoxin system